jgi:DnaJ family protein C protein 19
MSRREASRILGVSEMASTEAIGTAYKKVIMMNHPDKGGSLFIATKINQAKDTMLVK